MESSYLEFGRRKKDSQGLEKTRRVSMVRGTKSGELEPFRLTQSRGDMFGPRRQANRTLDVLGGLVGINGTGWNKLLNTLA
mmetsp:Transcript_12100/g.50277  ORF Transcript_12100/g.50277 Transcript_12100/m.50277 type:complete len:81 (-) Transcript_12100:6-248(-)